jgi:hypothetical protein
MQDSLNHLVALLPADLDLSSIVKFLLIFAGIVLIIGFIAKLLFGKNSNLNRSVCAAIGILFIYAITIVIYTFDPADLARLLAPLPYVIFSNDKLYLFVFEGTRLSVICSQALSMVILAFLYHLIDDFMPRGKGLHWLLYRLLTIVMAMALHYVATWATNTFLPAPLLSYAPTALLVILISLLLLGVLKVILGLVLTVVNPIIGAVYAFFFSSKLGKQLSKAVLTTLLLSILIMVLHYLGYSVISVSVASLSAYIPLILILLVLWYIIGHLL